MSDKRQLASLRSRRLEVVGTRKNGRSLTPCTSPSRAAILSFAHYSQVPAMQAIFILANIFELSNHSKEFDT